MSRINGITKEQLYERLITPWMVHYRYLDAKKQEINHNGIPQLSRKSAGNVNELVNELNDMHFINNYSYGVGGIRSLKSLPLYLEWLVSTVGSIIQDPKVLALTTPDALTVMNDMTNNIAEIFRIMYPTEYV